MPQIVSFDKMDVGKKGTGKHWTKKEVEARKQAAEKIKPKKRRLKIPEWLNDEARKVWKKTVKDMQEFEILESVDENMLAAYCDAVVKYKFFTTEVEREYISKAEKGKEDISAYVKGAQSYMRLIMQYSDKLGLSPSGRARLAKKIADEKIKNEAEELFDNI
jgi:P27 family predicted phage terminase small subunit